MSSTLFDQTALSFIHFSGQALLDFLQGLFTCDAQKLTPNTGSATLLCQHQGKTIASGILCLRSDSEAQLFLAQDLVAQVCDVLRPYAQLSRITITPADSSDLTYAYTAANAPDDMPATPFSCIWRADGLNMLCLQAKPYIALCSGPKEVATTWAAQRVHPTIKRLTCWQALLVQHGHVIVSSAVSGHFTPNMLSLVPSKTVSLNKGCYLGQEVIARTYHLGQVKRFLHTFHTDMIQVPLPAGTVLTLSHGDQKAHVVQSGIQDNTLWFQAVMPEISPPFEFLLQDTRYPDPLLFQASPYPVSYS